MIKIAVDAMGGDNSPKKIIDGIIHNHKSNKDVWYKIFGDPSPPIASTAILIKSDIVIEYYILLFWV